MFRNHDVKNEIMREQKYARQFIIALIMILLVTFNIGLYIYVKLDEFNVNLPAAYIVQAIFIPIMLGLMAYFYFRLHRKNIKRIKEKSEIDQ